MQHLILTLVVFGLAFAGMAIGVIVQGQRRELKGSCGGVGANPDCCMTCPDKPQCDEAHEAGRAVPGAAGADDDPAALVPLAAREGVPLAQSPSGQTAVRPF